MLEIQLMFNGMNRMVNFNENFLAKYCLDGFLKVPLSDESINVPAELQADLDAVIRNFKGIGKGQDKAH
jgi:hypothetical protein